MKCITRIDSQSFRSPVGHLLNLSISALVVAVLLSTVLDGQAAASVGGAASGSGAQSNIFDAGTNSALIELDFKPLAKPDSMTIYYPPKSAGGKVIYTSGGPVADGGFQSQVGGSFKGTSTLFEIIINEGLTHEQTQANGRNIWSYEGTAKDVDGNVLLNITMNQTTSATTPPPTTPPKPTFPTRPTQTPTSAGVTRVSIRGTAPTSVSQISTARPTTSRTVGINRVNLRVPSTWATP